MSDQVLVTAGRWSVASDGIQWILRRHNDQGSGWHPVSFVHSTREVLARCMREKGVSGAEAGELLAGLPATFDKRERDHAA